MKQLFRNICLLACAGLTLDAQAPFSTKTTDVMFRVIPKPGVQREQIQKVIPEEVRATVRLYLEGKIRQWYSRSDGKGVILIVDATSIADAETVVDALPLSKANLVDHRSPLHRRQHRSPPYAPIELANRTLRQRARLGHGQPRSWMHRGGNAAVLRSPAPSPSHGRGRPQPHRAVSPLDRQRYTASGTPPTVVSCTTPRAVSHHLKNAVLTLADTGIELKCVDVIVRGRKLAYGTSSRIHRRQALFVVFGLHDPGIGQHGIERSGGAGQVLGEQDRDPFAIGRPMRFREQAGEVGQLPRGASHAGRHVELKLACLFVIGEEHELLAIGRPGQAVLVGSAGGNVGRFGIASKQARRVDLRFAGTGGLDIGEARTIGRNHCFHGPDGGGDLG